MIPWKVWKVLRAPLPKLARMRLDEWRIDRLYERCIRKADGDERASLHAEWASEAGLLRDERQSYESNKLRRRARRLFLPMPEYGDPADREKYWTQSNHTGAWFMSEEGFELVRSRIRDELRGRQAERHRWHPTISLLIGLLGAAAALVAVLL